MIITMQFRPVGKLSLHSIQHRRVRVSCTTGKHYITCPTILQKEKRQTRTTHLTGSVRSPLRRSISLCGTGYQRKLSFQLKPPYVMSDPAMYSNVSSLITSMMGHTTVLLQQTQTFISLLLSTTLGEGFINHG